MLAWFRSLSRVRQLLVLAVALTVIAHAGFTAHQRAKRIGDYDVHREFGRRFLAGDPLYDDGLCFNYMPTSALYWAPMALVPSSVGTVVRYAVALVCLGFTLRWLGTMVRPHCRPEMWNTFSIVAWTLFLASHYLVRDLDDGGPHLILLAMLVGGIYCVSLGREKLAAVWFGLAIVLKMTPGLFLPYFIWKRKWRLAAYTSLATAAWIVLPAAWMGPSTWLADQRQWNSVAFSVFADKPDGVRDANELRVQNQSIKPAIMRWLVAYPPGHPLKLDHPADVTLLNLDTKLAGRLATLAMLGLVAICAWWSRRKLAGPQDPAWLVETSGVLIATVLFSPVTWLQHVVFVIPAVYLLVAHDRAIARFAPAAKAVVWLYVIMAIFLNRELLGKDLYLVLLSYHIHTLCQLLILGLLMWVRPTLPALEVNPAPASPAKPTLWREAEVWLLVALVLGVYFSRITDLSIRGEESRWAQVASEMMQTGDWVVPRQQGVPFPDRPPLNSWLMIVATKLVGGWNLAAVRLPSVLATLVTTLLIYGYGRGFLSRVGAFAAAAAFATMGQIMQLGRLAESDALLTCCMTAALLTWHAGYARGWPPLKTWPLGYSFAALAALAKGPQGPVYFVGATGLFLLLRRDWKFLVSWSHVAGLAAFAAIIGLWQVPYFLKLGWEDVNAVWSEGGTSIGHRMAYESVGQFLTHLVAYPLEVFGCMLPWSAMLLCYLGRPFRQSIGAARPFVFFLLTACAVAFPTCWLPVNSRPRFFVSLYPCVALLIGLAIERSWQLPGESWWHRGWQRFAWGAAIAMFVGGAVFGTARWWNTDSMSPLAQPASFAVVFALAAVAATATVVWSMRGAGLAHARAGILAIAAFSGLSYAGIAVNYQIATSYNIAGAVADVKEHLPKGEKLVSFGPLHHVFTYYFGQPIEQRDWPKADPGASYFCFFETRTDPARELPFAWEKVAVVPCDRSQVDSAGEVVVVGRRIEEPATVARQPGKTAQ